MVRWPMTKTERQKIQTSETPNQHIASEEVRTEKKRRFGRKKHKISRQDRIFEGIVYSILAVWTLLTIYPLIYVLSCSISPPEDVYMGRVFLFPTAIDFSSYAKVLKAPMIWRGYMNTIIYVVLGTLISCALTIPAGYVLSRKIFVLAAS